MGSDSFLFHCLSSTKKQAVQSRSGSIRGTTTNNINSPLREAVEIIKVSLFLNGRRRHTASRLIIVSMQDCLYYTALKSPPSPLQRHETITSSGDKKRIHYFCIDDELVYWNFFLDFGPLNLGQLYRFCTKLNHMVTNTKSILCFYSAAVAAKRANAIFLVCAWQVLYLNRTPEEAYRGFMPKTDAAISTNSRSPHHQSDDDDHDYRNVHVIQEEGEASFSNNNNNNSSARPLVANSLSVAKLPPFHDASPCACTYDLTILDCLRGLAKARMYGFFDFDTFSVEEYEHFEQVEVCCCC
jgi:hypothetical protein